MPRDRRRVFYSGRVQGVGFRATAHRLARRYPVAGFVRNLDDGRVELLAEGEPEAVDGFLAAVGGEFADFIRDVSVVREPPPAEPLEEFSIEY